MKGEKLLAVTLAALMTASSVGVSAFAEENAPAKAEQGEILVRENNNEENGVALFGATSLDTVTLNEVRVNSNSENTAKGFSCTFDYTTMPSLDTSWKFELKCGGKLLSTTTVKTNSSNIGNQVGTVFICWTGDNGTSGTWSTEMNVENITTTDKPDTLVMYVGDESKEFHFNLGETGDDTFNSLANVEDPSAVENIGLVSAGTSTNSGDTIEGISVTFENIKFSKNLEVNLCHNDTVLSTTKMKESSEYFNQQMPQISCLIGFGGDVKSNNHWSTELNVDNILSVGKNTLPNKVVVKLGTTEKEFELDNSNFINAAGDAYENFAIFRTPTLGTVEWTPNYKDDSQSVSVSMGNIGRVHNDMKVDLMNGDTVLATTTPKDSLVGKRTEALTAVIVCDGRFADASSSWSTELNVSNWARIKPNKVRITNNGVEKVCEISQEQGNYEGLKVANQEMTLIKTEAENNMTDSENPGKSAQALILTIGNVGYVNESMTVELYHDDTLLSKTIATEKRLRQSYNGLGVTVIVDGDDEVSGSWETTNVERANWSLDTAPNKAKVIIDGEEQWLDIDEIACYGKFTQFSIFGRSINVSADKDTVKAGENVTITVNLNGKNLTNAVYNLSYESDKFEFVSASTNTTPNNGTISEMLYKTEVEDTCFDDGETLATYVFKAIAQTEEVIADFEIRNTAASTYIESIDATKVATANNEKVSVTIELKEYEVVTKVDGEAVEEERLNVPYTNAGHTFAVEATPSASVSYKVNGGEATDSVSITGKGTYTIEYTITPETGYAKVTGTFTLVIGDPEYVVEVNTATENSDYVAGKKLVLIYTNTDGLAFKYGNDIMIDVTSRGYKYYDAQEYTHVYAFVTDAIADAEVDDYKENISCVIPSPKNLIALTYSTDLNFDNDLTVQDISVAYGIYNVNKDYFKNAKYQKNILRADTDGDKVVDNDDANAVVNAVKNK